MRGNLADFLTCQGVIWRATSKFMIKPQSLGPGWRRNHSCASSSVRFFQSKRPRTMPGLLQYLEGYCCDGDGTVGGVGVFGNGKSDDRVPVVLGAVAAGRSSTVAVWPLSLVK